MKLSIVSTLFHSSPYIKEFYCRVTAAAQELVGDDYEIILVNDGSPDDSLRQAIELTDIDPHVVVIDLSRNFGHHKAMMTGLIHTSGQQVFLIDSDLEEDPELLPVFAEQMAMDGSDMVYGIQVQRKGDIYEKVTGWIFYKIFRWLTGVPQPNNIATVRLMSQRYVRALVSHQEREINIGGLFIITGFKQSTYKITKFSNSPTTYTIGKKVSHFFNAITSFSSLPLVSAFYIGSTISLSACLYGLYLIVIFLSKTSVPSGYTSLIVSVWFFSGLIILFLGIQGIYLAKVFSEVKQRPYTIIRNIYRKLDV